jgi:hypothetical protein
MLASELRLLLRILGVTKAGRQPFPSKAREVEKLARNIPQEVWCGSIFKPPALTA